jgi:putative transposase
LIQRPLTPKGVIHHSDQGSQYTSIEFGHRCREAGVRPRWAQSEMPMTMRCARASSPHWNATQAEARLAVFAFIEGFYNPRRRHYAQHTNA